MEEDSFSSIIPPTRQERESPKACLPVKRREAQAGGYADHGSLIPVKEIHARAKAAGVSITVFLTAALIWAIHEEVPQNQAKKPIGLMIPVNLRNYFRPGLWQIFWMDRDQLLFSV